MRPLSRIPTWQQYKHYKSFKPLLLQSFGPYCAYCEKKDWDLDVEHVQPKSVSGLDTVWTNLLLACPTCNRDFKKAFNPSRSGYVFPDLDETFKVFHYHSSGTISALTAAAVATRHLCGLDRAGACSNRADAFLLAKQMKKEVQSGKRTPADTVIWAQHMGHWSVWMTVFFDVPSVLALLASPQAFAGTRTQFESPANPPVVR